MLDSGCWHSPVNLNLFWYANFQTPSILDLQFFPLGFVENIVTNCWFGSKCLHTVSSPALSLLLRVTHPVSIFSKTFKVRTMNLMQWKHPEPDWRTIVKLSIRSAWKAMHLPWVETEVWSMEVLVFSPCSRLNHSPWRVAGMLQLGWPQVLWSPHWVPHCPSTREIRSVQRIRTEGRRVMVTLYDGWISLLIYEQEYDVVVKETESTKLLDLRLKTKREHLSLWIFFFSSHSSSLPGKTTFPLLVLTMVLQGFFLSPFFVTRVFVRDFVRVLHFTNR